MTCDTDRILVHTHFPNTPTTTYEVTLEGLPDAPDHLHSTPDETRSLSGISAMLLSLLVVCAHLRQAHTPAAATAVLGC